MAPLLPLCVDQREEHRPFPSIDSDEVSINTSSSSSQHVPRHPWTALLRHSISTSRVGKKKGWRNRVILIAGVSLILGLIAAVVWLSLVITLIHRLTPRTLSTGVQTIAQHWNSPNDSVALLSPWPQDFSRDITPIPCHSHNDYIRRVPLYDALAVGCIGVEADIWARNDANGDSDLLIGHNSKSLQPDRTLRSLFLDPLLQILENQNANNTAYTVGVFDNSPNSTLILLIDFKEPDPILWTLLNQLLKPLRQKNWLTHWDNTTNNVTSAPITIVASGSASFDLVTSNTTHRDIFFDAPLEDIANPKYNTTNSYYGSASIKQALGKMWFGRFSSKQLDTIRTQVGAAAEKGLKSRYWDTVAWPISWRDYTWRILVGRGVGMLNVDDLVEASRWNWNWCVVAGLVLCGY